MSDYKPVVFENSLGETISNDPIYLAQKTLEAQGISFTASQPVDLQSQLASKAGSEGSPTEGTAPADDPDAEVEDTDDDAPRDYTDLSGKALASYAKERGLSLKDEDGNTKKVGAIRAELVELDKSGSQE